MAENYLNEQYWNLTRLSDGQIRFIGLSSMVLGLIGLLLFLG